MSLQIPTNLFSNIFNIAGISNSKTKKIVTFLLAAILFATGSVATFMSLQSDTEASGLCCYSFHCDGGSNAGERFGEDCSYGGSSCLERIEIACDSNYAVNHGTVSQNADCGTLSACQGSNPVDCNPTVNGNRVVTPNRDECNGERYTTFEFSRPMNGPNDSCFVDANNATGGAGENTAYGPNVVVEANPGPCFCEQVDIEYGGNNWGVSRGNWSDDCNGGTGPVCGDGVVEGNEECDDGNNVNGDGCSAQCTIEQAVEIDPLQIDKQATFVDTERIIGFNIDTTRIEIDYQLQVTNPNSVAVSNVIVVDTLDERVEGVEDISNGGRFVEATDQIRWDIANMAANETITLTYQVNFYSGSFGNPDVVSIPNTAIVCPDDNSNGNVDQGECDDQDDELVEVEIGDDPFETLGIDKIATSVDAEPTQGGNTRIVVDYRLRVSNFSDQRVDNVLVEDTIDDRVRNVINISNNGVYTDTANTSTDQILWNLGSIDPFGSIDLTYTAIFLASDFGANTDSVNIKNIADVCIDENGNTQVDADECVDRDDETVIVDIPVEPETEDPIINKRATGINISEGDGTQAINIEYELTVANPNDSPIDNVIVVDSLDERVYAVNSISDGGSFNNSTDQITWNLGTLAANSSETLTYTAVFLASDFNSQIIVIDNIADVCIDENGNAQVDQGECVDRDDETIEIEIPPLQVLPPEITKQATNVNIEAVNSEEVITINYEILVSNPNDDDLDNVIVVDTLDSRVQDVTNISDGGTFDNGTDQIIWNLGTINGNSNNLLSYQATFNAVDFASSPIVIDNIADVCLDENGNAQVDSGECVDQDDETVEIEIPSEPFCGNGIQEPGEQCDDGNDNNNDSCTNTCEVIEDLRIDKESINTDTDYIVDSGDNVDQEIDIDYELTVSNPDQVARQNVIVVDSLPSYVDRVSQISNGGTFDDVNDEITWFISSIPAESEVALTYTATYLGSELPQDRQIDNIADVCVDQNGNTQVDPGECEDQDDETVIPPEEEQPEVNVIKTASVAVAEDDRDVYVGYSINVRNDGQVPITGYSLIDQLDSKVSDSWVTNISDNGVLSNGVITWSGISLDAGQVFTVTYNVTIPEGNPGIYENLAILRDQDDNEVDRDEEDVIIQVTSRQCGETCTTDSQCGASQSCFQGQCALNICVIDPSQCESNLCEIKDEVEDPCGKYGICPPKTDIQIGDVTLADSDIILLGALFAAGAGLVFNSKVMLGKIGRFGV